MTQGESKYRQYIEGAKEKINELFTKERVMYVSEIKVRLDGSVDEKVRFWQWVTFDAIQEMYRKGELKRRRRRGTYRGQYDQDEEEGKLGSKITFYYPSQYNYGEIRDELTKKLDLINDLSSNSKEIGRYAEEILEEALPQAGFKVDQVTSPAGQGIRKFRGKEWKGKHDLDFIVHGAKEDRWYGIQLKNTLSYPDWDDVAGLIDICAFFGIRPWFVARQMPGEYVNDLLSCGGFYSLFLKWLIPDKMSALAERARTILGYPAVKKKEEAVDIVKKYIEVLHRY